MFKRLAAWTAAAAIFVVPFTAYTLPKLKHRSYQPATVAELVNVFREQARRTVPQAGVDLAKLSEKAGFNVTDLNLREWRLASADRLQVPDHDQCFVRLVLVSSHLIALALDV